MSCDASPRDWALGVADLSAAYRQGTTDPVSVCTQLLDRIARIDRATNAYTEISPDLLAAATESARRLRDGCPRSALEGIPLAVKDNLIAAGLHTTWGGRVFGALRDE